MYEHAACERSDSRCTLIQLMKMLIKELIKAISEDVYHPVGNGFLFVLDLFVLIC